MTQSGAKRGFLISLRWLQVAGLVVLVGFFVLGLLAFQIYRESPPIPERVVAPDGEVLFTGADILSGQELFLHNGLMQYGSVLGHGGYLGPDYTADALRHMARSVLEAHGGEVSAEARGRTIEELRTNRFDPATGTLAFTAAQASGFQQLLARYRDEFALPSSKTGLREGLFADPSELRQLTAFFTWTAWMAAARRPGETYSYTNNWPPEPLVGNTLTGAAVVWSALSLIALLGGVGVLLFAFGRWRMLGWHERDTAGLSFLRPDDVHLTRSQRACAWFFLTMSLLFLAQAILGGGSQHYRAELSDFFGMNLAAAFPFNLIRMWHVQLAIFWVATSYLAAGIFVAPMLSRQEPRGQHVLAYLLLGALALVVVGSMAGELAGLHGWARGTWLVVQGFEYLDLGRLWQVLLIAGLFFWVAIVFRALRGRLREEHHGNLPWLMFFAALAIPTFYAVGLLAHPASHFTVTDYWRFWVVHLWVEDFLELFTTVMVAVIFVLLGVVRERVALRLIYLDIILYSVGGVIGTMHHLYFSGAPVQHMALGAFFSAAEVIPLTFLTVEAWTFLRVGQVRGEVHAFPHRYAVLFLVATGFWNFLGAGVFGFLINLPVVSYYEIGTALTANHGHAAMMGVYGMLAVALALFALRYLIPEHRWSDRAARISFWSLNLGLAWMVFATLFPLGVLQLYESVSAGYFEARQLDYLTGPTLRFLEWLRLPGDALFILGGVVPLVLLCWRGVRGRKDVAESLKPEGLLFTQTASTEGGDGP